MKDALFRNMLNRCGEVFMVLRDGIGFSTRRPKVFLHFSRVEFGNNRLLTRTVVHISLRTTAEPAEVKAESTVILQQYNFVHFPGHNRLAIGGQTHYLVLIPVGAKTQQLGKRGIKNTQRMREINRLQYLYVFSPSDTHHGSGKISGTINREDYRFIKRAGKKGTCHVAAVVLNIMKPFLNHFARNRKILRHQGCQRLRSRGIVQPPAQCV